MISQSTPYTSFPSPKKYMYKEQPVPVSRLAHLLSDDLELYAGNNNQLKSIKRNKLNFFNDNDKMILATSVLTGVSDSLATKVQTEAALKLQQQKEKERKQILVFATGLAILTVIVIVVLKLRK